MYAQSIIDENLQDFARAKGWEPRYHTIREVEGFTAYIDSLVDVETNNRTGQVTIKKKLRFTEKRMREIRRWIENEQVLCSLDCSYFESRYAFICDEKGEVHRFAKRRSQEAFDHVIAHFEELRVAIELFVLKSRQVGISTATALKFIHRLLFLGHVQAVMASVEAEKSELIARILNICYERCPWWLVPRRTTERVGKMMAWENGSILSIQSGKQATGIAQGWTPTNIHVSELADIPNPKKVLEEGLLRATHPTRKLFQVWEGTGGGNSGWMADTWRAIKEDFPRGRARMCPVFIPWPLATDLYPEPDWLRKFPIPGDWEPCEQTLKHVRRAELFIRSTDYLRRSCGPTWVMPREQQWYWEFHYLASVKSRTQRIWFSQMPADDYEALMGKNDLVFTQEVIEVREQERRRNYQSYAIVGNTIDEGFEPDTSIIDYDLPRIEVHWDSHRGQHYDWLLVPLLPFDEEYEKLSYDRLLVFEPPIRNKDYSAGIDTADGLGKDDEDRAVCCMTANSRTQPDQQVAEFVSNRINPPQMVGFVACMAAWYGNVARDPRGVKCCIEQRERPGDDCQLQLKLMGFTWHHIMTRYDSKKVKETEGHKQGWFTNQWSRPMLLNRFVEAINNNWYVPHSKWLIAELQDFERKFTVSGKTRLEHQSGKHDDRVLSAALSYFTRHALEVLAERSTKEYTARRPALADVNYNYAETNQISVGEM